MKHKLTTSTLLLLALFSALAPAAFASTTWYVNGVSGSDGNNCLSPTTACKTIGHAISLAASGDSIMVAAATYRENLKISKSLNIIGSSATTTIVDTAPNVSSAVFYISSATANVSLSMLTVRQGFFGVDNVGTVTISHSTISANLTGVFNAGTMTISDSTISANSSSGGIYNDTGATLRINNSTISQNAADIDCIPIIGCAGGSGGGIYNLGTVTITNSTIAENSTSGGNGGGIFNDIGGTVRINNSTISQNAATVKCSSKCYGGSGGGIWNAGSTTLQNSIVANSPKGGNCHGTMTSKGYDMSSDGTCNFSNSGDRNSTNPLLGTLGNYGGPTQTIPLLLHSPAIDAGNPSGCTDGSGHLLKTDQRGYPRPDKEDSGGCDMGAFEKQSD